MAQPRLSAQRAQVLVFFALVLPLVLIPIAAYAVDASWTASGYSRLVGATARAAEQAAEQIDIARLRSAGGIAIDLNEAAGVAQAALSAAEPTARVLDMTAFGEQLRLVTTETVVLPFSFFGSPQVVLRATIAARIAPGYESPSALVPMRTETSGATMLSGNSLARQQDPGRLVQPGGLA